MGAKLWKMANKETIIINGHDIAIEGVHSKIAFIAISRALGIFGRGLINFEINGTMYKPSHFMINSPYFSENINKIDSGKIKIEKIN